MIRTYHLVNIFSGHVNQPSHRPIHATHFESRLENGTMVFKFYREEDGNSRLVAAFCGSGIMVQESDRNSGSNEAMSTTPVPANQINRAHAPAPQPVFEAQGVAFN